MRHISALGRFSTILLAGSASILAGCGSSTQAPGSSSVPSVAAPPSGSAQRSDTASSPAPSTSSGPAATVGASRGKPAGGSRTARVPATFIVRSGGKLDPQVISSPAFLAIQLTVVSGDGNAHQALLRTPTAQRLAVPARGRASVLIGGLRAARYDLAIDGVVRGGLEVGGQPGP